MTASGDKGGRIILLGITQAWVVMLELITFQYTGIWI